MLEEYCNNYGNQFSVENQEDASEFYIQLAASVDNNTDTSPGEKLYDIKVKQYLCCLQCDKRSSENDNKCLYLGLNTSKADVNSTVSDLTNNYFEDKLFVVAANL